MVYDDEDKEPIGRKSGTTMGTSMHRAPPVPNVKENWNELKAKIKQKWGGLKDKDVESYQGRTRDELVVFVYSEMGGDKTLVERDIDRFARETNYRW